VLDDIMHVLKAHAAKPPARLRARRFFKCRLLIIDSIGMRPLDRVEANVFLRLVSTRYERGSVHHNWNKHVRVWAEIFADDEILNHSDPGSPPAPRRRGPHQRPELSAPETRCPAQH
jgi:DNA replication protein DnaC